MTTTTAALTLCELLQDPRLLPPDVLTEEWDSIWDGTVTGSIQPVGCDPVDQTGSIVLIVSQGGDVFGVGRTDSGAYTCTNGAAISPSSYTYGIAGDMTDRFTLTFEDGVTLISGPITEGRATVVQDTGFGVNTIELACRDCAMDDPSTVDGDSADDS